MGLMTTMLGWELSKLYGHESGDEISPSHDPGDRAFWIGLGIVSLSLVSALLTYLILTNLTPIVPGRTVVLSVLFLNVVLIVAMIALLAWHISGLVKAWRQKRAGARLHVRIVALFSILAALPAIILAVAATVSFSRSLDSWFVGKTRAIIENSLDVAQAYLDEHGAVIRTDIVNMARDLDAAAQAVRDDAAQFRPLVIAQAGLRELNVATVLDAKGNPVVSAISDEKLPYVKPPAKYLKEAAKGQVPLFATRDVDRISAITRLETQPERYLYVSRAINPKVMNHVRRTNQQVAEYHRMRKARSNLKLAHALMYLMISMTSLLAAIWVGIWFTSRFVSPIRRLIGAAHQVSTGDLNVALPERRGEGDLRRLSATFNTMTRELKHQRDALVTANDQLLERRLFMEAVLSGVTAGVVGLDSQNRITLANRAAEDLLAQAQADLVGRRIVDVRPEFASVVVAASEGQVKGRPVDQIAIDVEGEERTFAVQVTRERSGGGDGGSVLTFDDVTELVVAQRTSAWADVAQRIAHEIKNPLTPIQLSAERIKRKYGKVIEDRETFDKLTDTIVRQVGDLKTMVDEFASFARMPKPEMAEHDLRDAMQEPVLLFRESHPQVKYDLHVPDEPVMGSFDRRLITQALTNLVKNATESIVSHCEAEGTPDTYKGWVETRLEVHDDHLTIDVIDNGAGLPKHNRTKLLEPYVTTKGHKGTGLGLAMVQKITEQHGGALSLDDAPRVEGRSGGARVRMTLPKGGSPDPKWGGTGHKDAAREELSNA